MGDDQRQLDLIQALEEEGQKLNPRAYKNSKDREFLHERFYQHEGDDYPKEDK